MSFRNTFVTDFIYQAGDDVIKANSRVTEIFKEYARSLSSEVDTNKGVGYYAGIISTGSLNLELSELGIEEMVSKLERATKVPFRLTILQESGAAITYAIEPRNT